jgi:hypothetical protein
MRFLARRHPPLIRETTHRWPSQEAQALVVDSGGEDRNGVRKVLQTADTGHNGSASMDGCVDCAGTDFHNSAVLENNR